MESNSFEESSASQEAHADAIGLGFIKRITAVNKRDVTTYSDKLNPNNLDYDLSGKGLVLIFSNKYYSKKFPFEEDHDIERLKRCFKVLNFDTEYETHPDVSVKNMEKIIDEAVNRESSEVSCLIIIVLTHGKPNKLRAGNGEYESSIFQKKIEGKLVGVPKLCIIQACEGSCLDMMKEVADSITVNDKNIRFMVPKMADYLEVYFSHYGPCVENDACWLIKSLCEVFETKHDKWDILQMLTYFNNKVAIDQKSTPELSNMPQIRSTLTKFLKF